jgi:signal transduction histidine kinase
LTVDNIVQFIDTNRGDNHAAVVALEICKRVNALFFLGEAERAEQLKSRIESIDRVSAAMRSFGHGTTVFEFHSTYARLLNVQERLNDILNHSFDDIITDYVNLYHRWEIIYRETARGSKAGTLKPNDTKRCSVEMELIGDGFKNIRNNIEVKIRQADPAIDKSPDKEQILQCVQWIRANFEQLLDILQSRNGMITGAPLVALWKPQECIIYPKAAFVTCEDRVSPDTRISANGLSIKSAIWNIAYNAYLFALKRGADASVKILLAEETVRGKQFLKIEITDNGEGIPPELLEIDPIMGRLKLFNLNVSNREGGSGLGTTEAWYAIKDAGGTIKVRSRQGEGATFTIRLPIAQITSPEEQAERLVEIDSSKGM